MICRDCSAEPRTHDGCAPAVVVLDHVKEHAVLEVALRRLGPRTSAHLFPASIRVARVTSELDCDVPTTYLLLRRQRHTAAMVTVHLSGMIPECTRHIINLEPSRSTPSCRDASGACCAVPGRHHHARSCCACDVSVPSAVQPWVASGMRRRQRPMCGT